MANFAITVTNTAPSVNNDQIHGYRAGQFWVDQSTNTSYQCVTPLPNGGALWIVLSAGGGGGSGFNWRGTWSSAANYLANDVVSYGGGAYIASGSNINQQPDISPSYWSLIVQGGISQAYADAHYRTKASDIWTQGVAATVWTITHNLGTYPAVTILDSAGTLIETDITWPDANTVVSTSAYPFSGEAILT
jgi:hypothetical protein